MRLDGKIAAITGAGCGLGRALALELANRGAHLLLVGRRIPALAETRAMLPDPDRAEIIPADITEPAGRDALVGQAWSAGRLDLLVNNCGLVQAGPLAAGDAEARRRMINANLTTPIELTLALLPLLRISTPARIVNVGSLLGDIALPLFAAYSATQSGLRGWSDALRRELAPDGIGVTYAAPRGTRLSAMEGYADLATAFAIRLDPPGLVAHQIADAIAADARSVYPRGIERWRVLLQRLLPATLDRTLIRQLADARLHLSLARLPRLSVLPRPPERR